MRIYRERVLPRLVECTCGSAELRRWRRRVTDGLSGTIIEIGFGSGLNLPHYPSEVNRIFAIEPVGTSTRRARERLDASPIEVEHLELGAERLPLDDASCDGALSTFTLCTIPDVQAALQELRRVIRPGGRFHFLEHGESPDPRVARRQRRLEPFQRRLGGGCHLTRRPANLVEEAGFELERAESRYARGPRPWTWLTEGFALNPGLPMPSRR